MGNKVSRARRIQPIAEPRGNPDTKSYALFDQIDGSHPFREALPDSYVDYEVRKRSDGKVFYFNFGLAKQIGLVPNEHAHELNAKLEAKILDTFALQIINEYDQLKATSFPRSRLKPKKYMATRYLQLQHRDKTGRTSGDGRSIWNGCIDNKGNTWDFSSCGTGVTCLSPGAVNAAKPIRTGSGSYSYGSGCAGLDEGIATAVASELLHKSGIETERVLAIIELPGSNAINVRASKNLLRPSHLFAPLKQEKLKLVESGLNYFIARQNRNLLWPLARNNKIRFPELLRWITRQYAEFAAQLENDYVFCWMDWDGDNMLATGGIIDYGSIRQFGLCHDRYRYDDDDRWSTNLTEQRVKARYIVQTFVQMVDYVRTGQKRSIEEFRTAKELKLFDEIFAEKRDLLLLRRIGFNEQTSRRILRDHKKEFKRLNSYFRWFESQKTNAGFRKTGDGINWYAIYAIREILVALPSHLVLNNSLMDDALFLSKIRTDYSSQATLRVDAFKSKKIQGFQKAYLNLVRAVSGKASPNSLLSEMIMRASQVNILAPVTGDGVLHATDRIIRARRHISQREMQQVLELFINEKSGKYHLAQSRSAAKLGKRAERLLQTLLRLTYDYRYSI